MEKHQLSSMMIGGLSLLAVVALILPAYADLKDDKKEICSGYGGDWKDNDCKMENENVYSEYLKDVNEIEEELADDEDINRYDVDVLCDASEDYEANKEQCDKLYDKVQDATLAFAEPNSKKEDKEFAKELCESDMYNGEWKGGECTNFPDGHDSAWMGFGDECEDTKFQDEHPYFCGEEE